MKRLVVVLSGLLVLPAFAEVAPVYYDEIMEYSDAEMLPSDDTQVTQEVVETNSVAAPVVVKKASARSTGRVASRALPSDQSAVTPRISTGRGTASRATVARTATMTPAATRAANSRAVRAASIGSAVSNKAISPRNVTASAKPAVAARASIVQTDTVNQPLYSGRVGVATRSSSLRARMPVSTSVVSATAISTDATDAGISADELAQLTDFCKAQYTECMDNYCNVLDENQGRCSCSKNLKNYEKTEEALKAATQALQDVAQQIQYIGLTGDQIETLFTQTEAEAAMQSNTDNTQLKNLITKIGNSLVEVKSGTASTSTGGLTMDFSGLLDGINFGGGIIDFSSFLGGESTSSINNQRGETLYKTAAARCKASVLNSCSNQGVDISVITNSYDLEIDKQCLVYERSLEEANDNMINTVRNARTVLQRARLMVDQQKNQYNLLECVQELDSCMQDEFVCGDDYEECLDPTGKYIVNGAVVAGSKPGTSGETDGTGLFATWTYGTNSTPWQENGSVSEYVDEYLGKVSSKDNAGKMAMFLQEKIGYIEGGKAYGMCAGVLNQCQQYTYDDKGEYIKNNDVIKTYLNRILLNIKSAQDEVLADYADDCIDEVATCLAANRVTVNETTAKKACSKIISTCGSVANMTEEELFQAATNAEVKVAGITYEIGDCATGWKAQPLNYALIGSELTLPQTSALNKKDGKTNYGWVWQKEDGSSQAEYADKENKVIVYGDLTFRLSCNDSNAN